MENFKVGDVVRLKSGSPRMTITRVSNNNETVECIWYDFDNHEWHRDIAFLALSLKIVDEESFEDYLIGTSESE